METKEKETELVQLVRQLGKFKNSTGKWIDAIIYERDNHMYMREITDFIDKFKKA